MPHELGLPMTALSETMTLFPSGAGIDIGICHHLRTTGHDTAMMVIVSASDGKAWRDEITDTIKDMPPEERWWKGLDVGNSSATIFGVLSSTEPFKSQARSEGKGGTPRDASDFGRCKRLVEGMNWRSRLHEVANDLPNWQPIVERWDELCSASAERVYDILQGVSA